MASILLTGADGYLGSRFAACLHRQNRAFDRLSCRLHDIAPGCLPQRYVIHCAGKTSLSVGSDYVADNVLGTAALMRGLQADARVVFVSSRKVYPPIANVWLDEDHLTAPSDAYGQSKLAAEQCIKQSGHKFVIFRAGAMFGHPEKVAKFPDQAVRAACAGQAITLAQPARQEDYLDVDVMAERLLQACCDGSHWGQIYNVSGPMRDLSDIINALNQACLETLGRAITIHHAHFPIPRFPWLNDDRLQATFPKLRQADDKQIFIRMLRAQNAF